MSEQELIDLIGDLAVALDMTTEFLGQELSAETIADFRARNRTLIDRGFNELIRAEQK